MPNLHPAQASAGELAPAPAVWDTARLSPSDTIIRLGIFAIAFFVAYWYAMSFSGSSAAPMWYPDAVLLAALLLNPTSTWWMFLLAPLPIRLFAVATAAPTWFLLVTFGI